MRGEEYHAGDVVVIRDWDDMEEEFGTNRIGNIRCRFIFTKEMKPLCGQTYEVAQEDEGHLYFKNPIGWNISTDMVRHVDDDSKQSSEIDTSGFIDILGF